MEALVDVQEVTNKFIVSVEKTCLSKRVPARRFLLPFRVWSNVALRSSRVGEPPAGKSGGSDGYVLGCSCNVTVFVELTACYRRSIGYRL